MRAQEINPAKLAIPRDTTTFLCATAQLCWIMMSSLKRVSSRTRIWWWNEFNVSARNAIKLEALI